LVRWGIVLAVVIVVLALAWRCRSDRSSQVRERSVASVARVNKVDRSVRGSIAGTVTDGAAPLAGALVCIEARPENLDPRCVASDANGAFAFGALVPDRYRVVASLATKQPGVAANSPGGVAGIKPGDIVTSVDGIDLRGFASMNIWRLLSAPPGTKLSFALARGVTVDVTLAKRN
jgi:membrane-associated protease RseP (regulator of RpoE activity)